MFDVQVIVQRDNISYNKMLRKMETVLRRSNCALNSVVVKFCEICLR